MQCQLSLAQRPVVVYVVAERSVVVCLVPACGLTCPRGPLLLAVTARPGQPRIVGAAAGGKHSLLWDASGRLFGMGCAASLGLHGKWLHAQENAYDGNRVSSLLNSRSISIHLSARVCVSFPPLRSPTVLCAMLYNPGATSGDVLTPHFIPLEEACWMALYGGGAPSDDTHYGPPFGRSPMLHFQLLPATNR